MFEHMAFKGTTEDRHHGLGRREGGAREGRGGLRRLRPRSAASPTGARRAKVARAREGLEGRHRRGRTSTSCRTSSAEIVDRAGGVGMNAFTSSDETGYFYSLPSNRLELWAYLESERFLNPVFREFYKERDVVMEERRMRTESQPIGPAHRAVPLRRVHGAPVRPADRRLALRSPRLLGHRRARRSSRSTTSPRTWSLAIVGDVKPAEALPLIAKYFGRLPKAPEPEPLRTESRRRRPSGRSSSARPRSPSTSRAITARRPRIPTTPSTT